VTSAEKVRVRCTYIQIPTMVASTAPVMPSASRRFLAHRASRIHAVTAPTVRASFVDVPSADDAPHWAQVASRLRWSLPQYAQRQLAPASAIRSSPTSVTLTAVAGLAGISYGSDLSLGSPQCWQDLWRPRFWCSQDEHRHVISICRRPGGKEAECITP